MFHNTTSSVYVYGGYEVMSDKAALSDSLYRVQLMKKRGVYDVMWNRIRSTDHSQVLIHSLVSSYIV